MHVAPEGAASKPSLRPRGCRQHLAHRATRAARTTPVLVALSSNDVIAVAH